MAQLSLIEGGQPPAEERFSYAALAPKVEEEVRDLTARIHSNVRMSAELAAEIGRDLLRVQKLVGHGGWLLWLRDEFPLSDRTARRWMRIAETDGRKLANMANLAVSVVDRLIAETTHEEVRAEVERLVAAGELVTLATVEKLQAEVDAAKQGAEAAEEEARKAAEEAALLQAEIDEHKQKAERDAYEAADQHYASKIEALEADLERAKQLAEQHAQQARQELAAGPEIMPKEPPAPQAAAMVVSLDAHREANKPQVSGEPAGDEEDENVPTDFDIQNSRHKAEAFSGALSTLDFVEVSPEAFWRIFEDESPAMRQRYYEKLMSAAEKINSVIKGYPYA